MTIEQHPDIWITEKLESAFSSLWSILLGIYLSWLYFCHKVFWGKTCIHKLTHSLCLKVRFVVIYFSVNKGKHPVILSK